MRLDVKLLSGAFVFFGLFLFGTGEILALKTIEIDVMKPPINCIIGKEYDNYLPDTQSYQYTKCDDPVLDGNNRAYQGAGWHLIGANIVGDGDNPLIIVESDTTITLSTMLDSIICPNTDCPAIVVKSGGVLKIADCKLSLMEYEKLLQQFIESDVQGSNELQIAILEEVIREYDDLSTRRFKLTISAASEGICPAIEVENGGVLIINGNEVDIKGDQQAPTIENNGTIFIDSKLSDNLKLLKLSIQGGVPLDTSQDAKAQSAIKGKGNVCVNDTGEECVIKCGAGAVAVDLQLKNNLDDHSPEYSDYSIKDGSYCQYGGHVTIISQGADALRVDGSIVVIAGSTLEVHAFDSDGENSEDDCWAICSRSLYVDKIVDGIDPNMHKTNEGGNVYAYGGLKCSGIYLKYGNIKSYPGKRTVNVLVNLLEITGGLFEATNFENSAMTALSAQLAPLFMGDIINRPCGQVLLKGGEVRLEGEQTGVQTFYLECSDGAHIISGVEKRDLFLSNNNGTTGQFVVLGGNLKLEHMKLDMVTYVDENNLPSAWNSLEGQGVYAQGRQLRENESVGNHIKVYPVAINVMSSGNAQGRIKKIGVDDDDLVEQNAKLLDGKAYLWVSGIQKNAVRVGLVIESDNIVNKYYSDFSLPLSDPLTASEVKDTLIMAINIGSNGYLKFEDNVVTKGGNYKISYGSNFIIKAYGEEGYELGNVMVNGNVINYNNGGYILFNVKNDLNLSVSFRKIVGNARTMHVRNIEYSESRPTEIEFLSDTNKYYSTRVTSVNTENKTADFKAKLPSGKYSMIINRENSLPFIVTDIFVYEYDDEDEDNDMEINKEITLTAGKILTRERHTGFNATVLIDELA